MKISVTADDAAAVRADVLVCAVGADWRRELAALDRAAGGHLATELARQGFQGGSGETATFQTHGSLAPHHVIAVGIGDGAGAAPWYAVAQTTVSRCGDLKAAHAAIAVAPSCDGAAAVALLAEALPLCDYRYTRYKSRDSRKVRLATVKLAAAGSARKLRDAVDRGAAVGRATCYARDLSNLPAAEATPAFLAREARAIGRRQKLAVKVLDAAAMKRLGMGGVLGVAQGSEQPPRFLELVYRPARRPRRVVALVGKGVTFDSGGLSLKPAGGMEGMKRDMAGGAAVLAVMSVIRDLAPGVEVRAYVPATENMPSGGAIKPGDVLRTRNGKTVEVLNTDAEGRLILADALAWAVEQKPDVVIDIATLTGAVHTVLGPRYAAILGTDRGLVADLIAAGRQCGEMFWELPLIDEYRSDIDSSIADLKNTGSGYAGTIIGGLFLREFVGRVPWAHLDCASTMVTSKPHPGHPAGATGFGVRTLLRWLHSA